MLTSGQLQSMCPWFDDAKSVSQCVTESFYNKRAGIMRKATFLCNMWYLWKIDEAQGTSRSGCPSQSVINLGSFHCHGLFPEDLTHLNRTEVPVTAQSVNSRGLLLQAQEAPVLGESSGRAVMEEALTSSLDQGQASRQKRSVKNTGPMEDHNWPQYFRDPCDPNPCQNDGICVNVKGMASCR